jgi:hypothetical protein
MEILSAVSIKCLNILHINTPTNFKGCLRIIIHANQFRQRLLDSEFSDSLKHWRVWNALRTG